MGRVEPKPAQSYSSGGQEQAQSLHLMRDEQIHMASFPRNIRQDIMRLRLTDVDRRLSLDVIDKAYLDLWVEVRQRSHHDVAARIKGNLKRLLSISIT